MWKFLALAAGIASPVLAADSVVDTVTMTPTAPLEMRVGGKVKKEALGYRYQWPGIYFEARFSSPFVTALFNDDANNFNILVDGKQVMIVQKPGHRSITIQAPGPGPHTVRVEKRSETQYAVGHFQGFIAQPADAPVTSLARQIEFIGDSRTVGYGNTSPFVDCSPEEVFETTNVQQGFGPIIARHFKADYQINAFSGLGMVRNFGGYEHPKYRMPMLYPRTLFDDPTPATRDGWAPQIIVVGIGGNDFSTPLKADEKWTSPAELRADYVKTYVAFVKKLRADNPKAFLILAAPGDRGDYTDGTREVFETLKAEGETRIDHLTIPPDKGNSCHHPDTRDDANIAKMYIDYVETHPDLWQGK